MTVECEYPNPANDYNFNFFAHLLEREREGGREETYSFDVATVVTRKDMAQ